MYNSTTTQPSLFTRLRATCPALVPMAISYQWSVEGFLILKGFPRSTITSLNCVQNSSLSDCDLLRSEEPD